MKLKPVPAARRAARNLSPAEPAPEPQPSDVRGLIDNATADRLFGWAWDANHPAARLKIELRLAGEVVANTIADFVRPDLAASGVGDGCHAFEFPLVPAWIERRPELTVVAFGADGIEFPIAMRLRRTEEAPAAGAPAQILRALEALQGGQEGLRAELAALRQRTASLPETAAIAAIRTGQEDLERKVAQLELWLTRLDGRLGDARPGGNPVNPGRLDKWQAVLIAALASTVSAALAYAIAQQLPLP
jgi:hypothetical protein